MTGHICRECKGTGEANVLSSPGRSGSTDFMEWQHYPCGHCDGTGLSPAIRDALDERLELQRDLNECHAHIGRMVEQIRKWQEVLGRDYPTDDELAIVTEEMEELIQRYSEPDGEA